MSIGFSGFVDEAGVALGLSPTETAPFSGIEPVLFSEARGAGLAVAELAAEARGSIRDGDAFSEEAGPQLASPARSNRHMGRARQGQTGSRDGRDRRMPSGLSGNVVNEHVIAYTYAARFIRLSQCQYNTHR